MRNHTKIGLLTLATVLALPATAEAKAKHHHAAGGNVEKVSTANELVIAQAEIAQQQAQINDLKSLLEKQSAAIASLQNQTATTQQVATNAATKADQAQTTAVAAKAAAAKPAIPEAVKWAADTKLGATVFFNATNVFAQSNGVRSGNNGTGLNVKRIYVSLDHTFNKTFSANITLDAANVVGNTSFYANTQGQNQTPSTNIIGATTTPNVSSQSVVGKGLFVKFAYLQAKIDPALIVRVGAAPTTWIPYIDNITGTRYIDQGLTERDKFGNSADWGIHALGDLAGGHISYAFAVVDGAGYRKLYVTKNVDVEGRISAQYNGVFAAVGGLTGKEGLVNANAGAPGLHTYNRFNAAAGYKNDRFTIGGEYLWAKNLNTVTKIPQDKSEAFSVFGKVVVTPKIAVLGRYDWVKYQGDETAANAARDHYAFAGIQYEPYKFVDLTLLYKREAVNNTLFATALSTNNGNFNANARSTYDEVGLFGQFKF